MNRSYTSSPLALYAALFSLFFLVACSSPPQPPTATLPPPTEAPPTLDSVTAVPETPVPPTAPASAALPSPTPMESGAVFLSPDGSALGRLAVISPSGALSTINPDGSDGRTLQRTGLFQFPAWSPNSDEIAVIGSSDGRPGVFVTADDPEAELVTLYNDSSPIYLYWSPDGEQVSFIANHSSGLALHVAPPDGSEESTVLSTGQPFYWSWYPDSAQAITHVGSQNIARLNLEGEESDLGFGRGGRFQSPVLSATGSYVALSHELDDDVRSLLVRDLENDTTVFSQEHQGVLAMGWSPTADRLAYISPDERAGTFFGPLQIYDVATGESQLYVEDDVLAFFWSPNGRYLAYLSMARGGQQAERRTMVARPNQQNVGRVTLFLLDLETGGRRDLYYYQMPILFMTQFLPFFDQYAQSHRIWSPNSSHIALPVRTDDGTNRIVVIPIDGRQPETIVDGVAAFWSHR